MARDIEEFLKMAAKRREQQKAQGGSPAPAQTPPQRLAPARRVDNPPIVDTHVIEAPESTLRDHVSTHLDTSDIVEHAEELSEHAGHLGEKIGQTDEKVADRLHSKFDHKIGSLSQSGEHEITTTTKRATSQAAEQLMVMLSDPSNVRSAILLHEILKRPDFD